MKANLLMYKNEKDFLVEFNLQAVDLLKQAEGQGNKKT